RSRPLSSSKGGRLIAAHVIRVPLERIVRHIAGFLDRVSQSDEAMTPPPPYLVLDACLWIDVLLTEGSHRRAAQLLADAPTALLVGPPHLRAEVTHALHGRTRRTRNFPLTPGEAQRALTEFLRLHLMTLEP